MPVGVVSFKVSATGINYSRMKTCDCGECSEWWEQGPTESQCYYQGASCRDLLACLILLTCSSKRQTSEIIFLLVKPPCSLEYDSGLRS